MYHILLSSSSCFHWFSCLPRSFLRLVHAWPVGGTYCLGSCNYRLFSIALELNHHSRIARMLCADWGKSKEIVSYVAYPAVVERFICRDVVLGAAGDAEE